jgi:Glycosyl transferase 4-like domain
VRVLFLQRQPCMRALKYAVGLRGAAPEVRLWFAYQGRTLGELYGSGDELFEEWLPLSLDPGPDLARAVDRVRPDVVHSHNLPDELTVAAQRETGGRAPVIHDVHDLQSLRVTPYEDGFPEPEDPLALERAAVEGSDGLLTVSDELMEEIGARYRMPGDRLAFPNYALRRDLPVALPPPERPLGERPRLVYQGTLSTNGGHYDLREVFRRIVEGGASLDVYSARASGAYRDLARSLPHVRYHEPLEPPALMRELTAYDFGWAGFNPELNALHLDTALPNKAYDYIACGLPVLTLGHRALTRMIAEAGVGVSLDSPDDLGRRLRELDLPALRRRVAAARERLTVEGNILRVAAFYRRLAAAG